MKKFVSHVLIYSILLFYFPVNFCCSIDSNKNISNNRIKNDCDNKSKEDSISTSFNTCCNADKEKINNKNYINSLKPLRFRGFRNVPSKRPIKKIRVLRFKNNSQALFKLKKDILEITKDQNFTDAVLKNYSLSHEDPLLIKCIKMPFSMIYNICKKVLDCTVGYLIGRKASDFIENVIIPGVMCLALYKKVPFIKQNVDWSMSYFFDENDK